MTMEAAHRAYVEKASPRFQDAYAAFAKVVKRTFPKAEASMSHGLPMWAARRPKGAPSPGIEGTVDPAFTYVGLADRKAGVTVYVWYPGDYYLLDEHKAELAKSGLKTMRGCIQFTRKADLPVDALARVLEDAKARDRKR